MAETLETGVLVREPALRRPTPSLRPAPRPAPAAIALGGLVRSAAEAFEQRRFIVLLPIAMIGGLIGMIELPVLPWPWALAGVAVVIAVAAIASVRSLLRFRLALLAAAAWAGMCLLPIHGALFGTAMLAWPAYGTYRARVDEVLSQGEGETRVVLSAITPADGKTRPVPVRRARILIRATPELAPGDILSGRFRFAPVPGPVYPGGFDTQFHAYFDGIGAYGSALGTPELTVSGNAAEPARVIDAIRRGIAARIDAVLSQPAAGIARAIVTGDQSAVTDAARTTMATAGIAHVLSVSGLHLSIVAGGVFAALRLLFGFEAVARRVSAKRLAAVGGLAAAIGYFAISGGNIAAFRSTLMIALVFGAVLVGRRAVTMRNVAIAAIVVIATDPAGVFRPSFQLSFAAVVALVGVYENLRPRAGANGLLAHVWGYAKGIVVTSLVAGLATVLFSVYHFQQTSPLGVAGNLLTLPLVGFVMMPAAVIAVAAMPFGLEWPFLSAMGWSIDRMLDLAGLVAGWSEHLRASPLLTPWALLIGLAALGWFAFFRDRWRLAAPVLAVPLVVLFGVDRPPDVLIADTTQSLAIRQTGGLALADGRPKSFALGVWRETYADPIATPAAESCDSLACVGQGTSGFSFAIVTDPAGFAEECGHADLVVTRGYAPVWCKGSTVIDAAALHHHGVHWLRWDAKARRFELRTAIGDLNRPWRIGY